MAGEGRDRAGGGWLHGGTADPGPRRGRRPTILLEHPPKSITDPPAPKRGQVAGRNLRCGPLESRWKKSYNGDLRWVHPDLVAICSRRASMSSSPLTPEQAEQAERIFQSLRQAVESDLRSLAELLASKPDRQLLGQTEFEVRDRVHTIGAKAIETALKERKKGGTRGPV